MCSTSVNFTRNPLARVLLARYTSDSPSAAIFSSSDSVAPASRAEKSRSA
jgi:hypothetical protein